MPPRGRKPKPAAVRAREGNPGHRPIKGLDLAVGEPEKPEFLDEFAEEEWDRVVPELVRTGVAGRSHTAALTAMCVQWGIAENCRRVYEEEGLVEEGSMGQMVAHPMIGEYGKAIAAYLRIATEFGLTASAAARIDLAKGLLTEPFSEIGASPRRLRAVK